MQKLFRLFSQNKKQPPRGLHIVATESAVILYNDGAKIPITPDLAEHLAVILPRYAKISRALAGQAEAGNENATV